MGWENVGQKRIEELEAGAAPQNQDEIDALSRDNAEKAAIAKYGPDYASQGTMSNGGDSHTFLRPGYEDRPWDALRQPSAYNLGGSMGGVSQQEVDRYGLMAQNAQGRLGAPILNGQYNDDRGLEMAARGNQDYAFNAFKNAYEGNGPSVAERQMAEGFGNAAAQQANISASARGGGAQLAAAQRQGASTAAGLMAGSTQAAGLVRAQEQLGAMQGLASTAAQQRANDLQRAGMSADQAFRQAQIEQQQHGLNDAMSMGYEQQRQRVYEDQTAARQAGEAMQHGIVASDADRAQRQQESDRQQTNAIVQGAVTAGGTAIALLDKNTGGNTAAAPAQPATTTTTAPNAATSMSTKSYEGATGSGYAPWARPQQMGVQRAIGAQSNPEMSGLASALPAPQLPAPQLPAPQHTMMSPQTTPPDARMRRIADLTSDVTKKKAIGDGARAVSDQLATMKPDTYRYRDPQKYGDGARVGVMAQDAERGPYGHQLVHQTPDGKKIDGPGGLSLALAGAANHEQRLRAIEAATGGGAVRATAQSAPVQRAAETPIASAVGGYPVRAATQAAANAPQFQGAASSPVTTAMGGYVPAQAIAAAVPNGGARIGDYLAGGVPSLIGGSFLRGGGGGGLEQAATPKIDEYPAFAPTYAYRGGR